MFECDAHGRSFAQETRVTDNLQRLKRFFFGERTCVTIGINTLLLDHHKHITLDSYQVCQFMQ